MIRRTLLLLLLFTPLARAGEVSDVAIKAQTAWQAGDGETLIAIAHPTLIARIARLQQTWLEQEANGTGGRPWVKFPAAAPTLAALKKLPIVDQARSYFTCMHGILSEHRGLTFSYEAEDDVVSGDNATVTVVEHQRGAEGHSRDVRYPFIFVRVAGQWKYVSGGSERLHVDTQLMLLAP